MGEDDDTRTPRGIGGRCSRACFTTPGAGAVRRDRGANSMARCSSARRPHTMPSRQSPERWRLTDVVGLAAHVDAFDVEHETADDVLVEFDDERLGQDVRFRELRSALLEGAIPG
ncbi:hypothetical protein EXE59_16410 [Nocardioides eburneiflavus]|uniref:Uncharacterized protein n=1 Tax=Nocardioides eburneiflavus TaxID=2518372 RepID=A0A4Z1CHY2_9ACTN|nr:hypothetical protein [Nocardioides eburneiflavus]TGN65367.1 hypothetical protein EXE59_16410 [Nocardioides eburneiflavus]